MKTLILTALAAGLASAPAFAQKLDLTFDGLAAKAKDHSEINLEGPMLTQILQGAKAKVGDKAEAIFGGVEGVAIRSYEFDKPGQYSDADLAPLRKQVGSGSGWSRIVDVKEPDESTQIYLLNQGGQQTGLLIIAAEAKELNVIHIRGSISLAQAQELVNSTIHYDMSKVQQPAEKQ